MKNFTLLQTIATVTLNLGFCASALAGGNSKIICNYDSVGGQGETVTFEGPSGIDLSRPNGLTSIPLRLNGSENPMIFTVNQITSSNGLKLIYSYRNQLWISSIVLNYEASSLRGTERFGGTWTVDHPPTLQLACRFDN